MKALAGATTPRKIPYCRACAALRPHVRGGAVSGASGSLRNQRRPDRPDFTRVWARCIRRVMRHWQRRIQCSPRSRGHTRRRFSISPSTRAAGAVERRSHDVARLIRRERGFRPLPALAGDHRRRQGRGASTRSWPRPSTNATGRQFRPARGPQRPPVRAAADHRGVPRTGRQGARRSVRRRHLGRRR